MESASQGKTTQNVLAHVERAKDPLKNINPDNLSSNGAFMHPSRQLVSLKVAREELNKAIALMEHARWTR